MAVKFHCPKCGRRFVDWGAEKLGFKCPDCKEQELVRLGSQNDEPAKRPAVKRRKKPEETEAVGVFAPYELEREEAPEAADLAFSIEGGGLETFTDEEPAETEDAGAADFDAEPAEAAEDLDE